MRTLKFRLFATMITLAAVTYIITPANAQRRSTERQNTSRETKSVNDTKKTVEKKNTFKNNNKADRNQVTRDLNRQRNTTVNSRNERSTIPNHGSTSFGTKRDESRSVFSNQGNRSESAFEGRTNRNTTSRSTREQPKREYVKGNSSSTLDHSRNIAIQNSNTSTRTATFTDDGRRNTGRTVSNNRDFYRTDKNDQRYSPNQDFRGSKQNWSERQRPHNMNYNHQDRNYYVNYNFDKHKHWDRSWERYRWNYNSWCDYYRGYNPLSFVYYRYYFHDPRYGHVIRRFDFRPMVFINNYDRYYFFEGHFFRHLPGVGYVLVDLPYGFTFDVLPTGYYERAYINGYLYFRVGNLFFESTGFGYSLVHYPERYYAWDNSYSRHGYMFDDMY